MHQRTDYYKTLNVSSIASLDEIKKAYKQLSLKWHPDRNLGNEAVATEKIQQINQAYAVLSDPQKRRNYDLLFQSIPAKTNLSRSFFPGRRNAPASSASDTDSIDNILPYEMMLCIFSFFKTFGIIDSYTS